MRRLPSLPGLASLLIAACVAASRFAAAQSPPWLFVDTLPGNEAGALQGAAIAADGGWIAMGAPDADVLDGVLMADAGRVHIFRRVVENYAPEVEIESQDPQAGARFGAAVSLWGDHLMIGAPNYGDDAGRIEFWRFDTQLSRWVFVSAFNTSPGLRLGAAVSINRDRAAAGMPGAPQAGLLEAGRVLLLQRPASDQPFAFDDTLLPMNPVAGGRFGAAVAMQDSPILIGTQPDRVVIGEPGSGLGRAIAYEASAGGFTFSAVFDAPAGYVGSGYGGAIAMAGARVYIGGLSGDRVGVHERIENVGWGAYPALLPPTSSVAAARFGRSLAAEGNRLVIGHPRVASGDPPGRAWLFQGGATGAPSYAFPFLLVDGLAGPWASYGQGVAIDGHFVALAAPLAPAGGLTESGNGGYYYQRDVFVDGFEEFE